MANFLSNKEVMAAAAIERVSLGGRDFIAVQSLLDFISIRATLTIEGIRVRGTPLGDTEFLRGQSFEQEIIKHAIQSPT
jgi:hypothetical protein